MPPSIPITHISNEKKFDEDNLNSKIKSISCTKSPSCNEKTILFSSKTSKNSKDPQKCDEHIKCKISNESLEDILKKFQPKCCPLSTPWRRRLQTLIVAWHVGSFLYILILALVCLANPLLWIIMGPYSLYYLFDRTPVNGMITKRYSVWVRSWKIWSYYCDYFPIKLHKTVDLEPTFINTTNKHNLQQNDRKKTKKFVFLIRGVMEKNPIGPRYIFGYHPHGIAALGAFGAFGTEGCKWSELFPGIPVCLMTLVNQFQIPFYRDYLLSLGVTSVAKKNALKIIEQNYSLCIVVGGAHESLLSKLGSAELILKKRKGFIKLAMEVGNVCLVPTYAFGETDCFNIVELSHESYLYKFQLWVKRNYGFTIPFFFARGIFNYDFGLVPFRKSINIVVGNPIYVKQRYENPSMDEINYYQELYITELKRIFDDNKEKFGYKHLELTISE